MSVVLVQVPRPRVSTSNANILMIIVPATIIMFYTCFFNNDLGYGGTLKGFNKFVGRTTRRYTYYFAIHYYRVRSRHAKVNVTNVRGQGSLYDNFLRRFAGVYHIGVPVIIRVLHNFPFRVFGVEPVLQRVNLMSTRGELRFYGVSRSNSLQGRGIFGVLCRSGGEGAVFRRGGVPT